jgi:phage baseplate assembly protein W
MSVPLYRGWQYLHPDLEATDEFAGLQRSPKGGVSMVQGHDAVRQAILLLLSTVPGERVMRPDYGCALHRLVFSPNDDTTAGLAIHYARRALERWEPRIDILRLDASRDDDVLERLLLLLEYRVRATRQTQSLTYPVDLAGGQA